MSVDNIVILERENMPTPEQWARAISEHGFELQMDVEFDPAAFVGYLPCRYRNEECGFEYSISEMEDGFLEEDEVEQVGVRNAVVTLTTHGDFLELMASTIAASVLCSISDGLFLDDGIPPFITAANSIQFAKDQETVLLRFIDSEE